MDVSAPAGFHLKGWRLRDNDRDASGA